MKTIYTNAKVYTGTLPLQEAFGEENGVICGVGSNAELLQTRQEGDKVVDLKGGFVCPGFIDSHMHVLNYGKFLQNADLSQHTDSLEGMLAYVSEFAAQHPPKGNEWIIGRGWNHDYFTDTNRMPTRWDLDRISTEYPVVLTRCCGHALTINSKAIELLGLTADTPQPEGGAIGVVDGQPDGIVLDNSMNMVYEAIPLPDKESVKQMIRLSCRALNKVGITEAHSDDYESYPALPWQLVKEAFEELEADGTLTVRIYEQSNFPTLEGLKEFVAAGNNTCVGTPMFRTGPLKIVGDGSLGARTAYMSAPYADDASTCGFPLFNQQELDDMIGYAHSIGMQVAVHCIGDKSVDMVLDAVEKAQKANPCADHRHGIVHCQVTRADQLQRLIDMNMHIYAQSIFIDYDSHIVEARVGKEKASTSYSWKTLLQGGLSVSNGTDCPVERPDPLRSMQCAVTRRSLNQSNQPYLPHEAFTVQEALDSYTIHGAIASFEENGKGRILPGYVADFVVLGQDPFQTDAEALKDIPVLATYLGGKNVYTA